MGRVDRAAKRTDAHKAQCKSVSPPPPLCLAALCVDFAIIASTLLLSFLISLLSLSFHHYHHTILVTQLHIKDGMYRRTQGMVQFLQSSLCRLLEERDD